MLTHISGSSLEVTVDTPPHPCPRGITLPSPPAPLRTPHAAAAAAAAAFPLSPSAAAGHAAGLGPQEASPRAGGRPADFDPAVAAGPQPPSLPPPPAASTRCCGRKRATSRTVRTRLPQCRPSTSPPAPRPAAAAPGLCHQCIGGSLRVHYEHTTLV